MKIEISKTDFKALVALVDKCYAIIQSKQPSVREYNSARLLRQVKKGIIRKNQKVLTENNIEL